MKNISFKNYLLFPRYIKCEKINWLHFFKIFIVSSVVTMILSSIAYFLKDQLHIEHNVPKHNLMLVLHAVVWAPIMEEIWFRLLLRPTNRNLRFFIGLSILGSVYVFFKAAFITGTIVIIAGTLAGFILKEKKSSRVKLLRKYFKFYPVIYYFIVLLFGLVHLMNFNYGDLELWMYMMLPILIFPQLYAGIVLGYIRMRYGILYSILYHTLNNLIPLIPFILSAIK
ncbi:CPBP family glutamic-type intramembrane protease [Labilibaculum sp. K2S]|uniref:CPBP family glutamic-type intramembrane protease n=1 Tax=Labilibaculum sp. K2S TaxID=3056386 RepID=UPI0025A380C6|nr:CPBP family glutamic-type intramembrane protease [Labilibaculum sp. K2S]MDM8160956.1 CPBP family glutamic-type intramembrane protease [Labilibaculum sp. K2S]